jgi:hypothetical protein
VLLLLYEKGSEYQAVSAEAIRASALHWNLTPFNGQLEVVEGRIQPLLPRFPDLAFPLGYYQCLVPKSLIQLKHCWEIQSFPWRFKA